MTCRNCGNEVAAQLKFCSKCGTPVPTSPYTPPAYQQPSWQVNAPASPVKPKSRVGKILLIVGIVLVLIVSGVGIAIYFGVRSYVKSTKSSEPYLLAESTLRASPRVKERMGEITSVGVPIGTYKEEDDGTGFAAFVMSVVGERASGNYIVGMDRKNSIWRVATAKVQLIAGGEIIVEGQPKDSSTDESSEPPDINVDSNQNQNSNTGNSNRGKQKPNTISGGVLNGKATSLPKPPYPPVARTARASGSVVVEVLVDEDGKVISATAISGHPLLRPAAVAAARQARFSPSKLGGDPVKVSGTLIYNFVAEP